MPQINNHNIEITDDDIKYTESILLKEGQTFDNERKDFIKNLDTIDLQAVPGSGKTTALLAKLLILERKMPFSDGSGILVLSHTNTAVDEIKERIGKYAPKLFEFPNFIGTIQEFVNKFLAKPYGVNFLGINFQHIDSEYYESKCYIGYNGWLDRRRDKNDILSKSIKNGNVLFYPNGVDFPLKDNTKDLYRKILEMKTNILNKGIISYDEAYYYGDLYLEKFPKIKKILQKRFKCIFVDEMQDMGKHQVGILEKIFYDDGSSESFLQRIGDENQAIYDSKVKAENLWDNSGRKKLKIVGSHRFTQEIANVVKCFGLTNNNLIGKREILNNGEDISKKPILIVYDDRYLNNENPEKKDNKILEKFSEIIKSKGEEYFDGVEKIISKAIIWNAKPQDGGFNLEQCRVKHYFFDYSVEGNKPKNKTWFKSEKDYLYYYDKENNPLKSKYNNIINLFLRYLRENNIKNKNDKYFNKTSLFKYLKENYEEKYIEFKTKLFKWSEKLDNSNIDDIAEELDVYFPSIYDILPGTVNILFRIRDSDYTEGLFVSTDNTSKLNTFISDDGIEISIGTVHGVKGETHTCTLYMESCYHPPSRGINRLNKGYESIRLENNFKGNILNLTKTYDLETIKMLYVGLSRPTHLLCYAIHKDRYEKLIEGSGNEEKLKELWDCV